MNFAPLKGQIPDNVFDQLTETCDKFQINTKERLAHFLGQCAHESGGFRHTIENLNYSADGLLKTFPRYFNASIVNNYARKPELIANRVYAGRMGNGDEASGDGWKHRGRGYIQLTGKSNQAGFLNFIGLGPDASPETIDTKFPLLSAAYFWDSKKLNTVADKGMNDAVIREITLKINGGTNGLPERTQLTKKYFSLLSL